MCEVNNKCISGSRIVSLMSRFFDINFLKNIAAGIISGLIVSGSIYLYLKPFIDSTRQLAKHVAESALTVGETIYKSSVVETPDGTKFYKYRHGGRNYDVIEDKNGKITLIFTGPFH
jgi:hypothetical protein